MEMRTSIFNPIINKKDFKYGVIKGITEQLEERQIQLPADEDIQAVIETVIPSVVWVFFMKFHPGTALQEEVEEWAMEYGNMLLNYKKDSDLETVQSEFLESKGFPPSMREMLI